MTGADEVGGDRVELRLPADPRFVRVARLGASGIGASAGFDVDRIEDLKIAVGEVCATLIEVGDGSQIVLGLAMTPAGTVRVDASVRVDADQAPDANRFALTEKILGVICGNTGFERTDAEASFAFEVARSPHSPNASLN